MYSNLVIISDTSGRPPQQVENPPYSLQLSHIYSRAQLRNITLSSSISKKFYSCGGRKSKHQLAKITGFYLISSYSMYDLNTMEITKKKITKNSEASCSYVIKLLV